jgi:hypothetical protein
MSKGRVALVAGVIAAVCALLLGLSGVPASASASARGTKVVIVDMSPSQPTAGQSFTMKFQLVKNGVGQHIADFGCYAQAGGRVVPLVDVGVRRTVGHCTWSIPTGAKGMTFDGLAAITADNGVTWYRGFDLPIL